MLRSLTSSESNKFSCVVRLGVLKAEKPLRMIGVAFCFFESLVESG